MLAVDVLAALPVLVLLGAIGIFEMGRISPPCSGFRSALVAPSLGFGMPAGMALMSAVYGPASACCRSAGSSST